MDLLKTLGKGAAMFLFIFLTFLVIFGLAAAILAVGFILFSLATILLAFASPNFVVFIVVIIVLALIAAFCYCIEEGWDF